MATLGEIQDSIDLLTVEVTALKKNLVEQSNTAERLERLPEKVEAVAREGAREAVSAINSGIEKLQKTTNQKLQQTINTVEKRIQKDEADAVSRNDIIMYVACFLIGVILCFSIVRIYTDNLIQASYQTAVEKAAEEPRKEAEAEAKRILAEAQKQAEAIIQEAQKK